eukprot:gene7638-8479_t
MHHRYGTPIIETKLNSWKKFKKAARWAMNQHSWATSVSDLQRQLEWPALHQRRLYARLVLMFKIKNNDIAIPLPSYIMMPTMRSTRSLSSGAWRPIQMNTSCDSYKYSFFSRTIVDWNRLPDKVTMTKDLERFKTAVANHVFTY